jgi:RecA/RadA recombinase
MASVAEIAKKLNKEFKNDNLIVKGDLIKATEKLPTMAFGMDYPLFGGLPLGHICVYSGLPHSGKTTAACQELAAFQKAFPDKECVYVDSEHRLELDFQARMNHVDLSRLNYINIPAGMAGEQVLDLIIEMQKADNIGMIILDSVPSLLPAAVLKSDMTEDPGLRGTMAKKMYPFLNEMKAMLTEKQNILILINQVRDGGMVNGIQIYKEPCGLALQFMPSVAVRFGKRKFTLGDNMNACASANGEGSDGFRLQFKITKNSTAQPTRGGGFITYRYATGIDWLNDLIEIAEGFDFIVKNGSYRTLVNLETGEPYVDESGKILKGYMGDLKEYIKTHTDFQRTYVEMLQRHISSNSKSYGTLLSKEDDDYIASQEASLAKEERL